MPKKKGGTPSTPSSTISSSAAAQRFSRTKTGCFTCRARRKKCDEERDPQSGACTRCRNSGIECLGFPAMKSAPASAFKKQRKEEARQEKRAPQEGPAVARAATREVTFEQDRENGDDEEEVEEEEGGGQRSHLLEPIISPDQHTPAHIRDVPEENVARWADLMALDDGEQLFYEGLLYDAPFDQNSNNNINMLGTSTLASSRAISVDLPQVGETPSDFAAAATTALQARQQLELEQQQQHFHHHQQQQQHRPRTISMEMAQQEQRMLTVLANYYAMVSWYRWQPVRHSGCYYSKEQLASSLLSRLERSEVLCISVASVAACYAYSDMVSLPENSIQRSLLKHWTTIYDLVTSTKTRKLTAFLEWLTQTSLVDGRDKRNGDGENSVLPKRNNSEAAATSENHRDTLFSLASQVLEQISQAANQDQELPMDRSNPLDTAALVHVDKYVHAAMDLATVAYATRSSRAFLDRLNSASELVSSLLGRSQCVRLADLQGIETTGFRAFAWADIINAVLSGRSTFVHYLSDDEARNLRLHATQQSKSRRGGGSRRGAAAGDEVAGQDDNDSDDDDRDEEPQKDGLRISFGCPDDVLIVMAAIANLHFQLRHARKAKALSGQGYEALPAWALHTALEYGRRLSASQAEADARHHHQQKKHHQHHHQMHHKSSSSRSGEQHYLATMWRHAAFILLNTTIYRQGPLSASNQSRLTAILDIYKSDRLRPMTIALGSLALTLLLASFVAVLPDHRKGCLDALHTIGQREKGRSDYRHFVKRLWKHSDETGFAVLWQDLLLDDDNDTTLVMF